MESKITENNNISKTILKTSPKNKSKIAKDNETINLNYSKDYYNSDNSEKIYNKTLKKSSK